ncbi:MAG: VTT domain-containing protein [Tepidanaerobacteraceae bacterium]|nr:VTT domain-containing protein [Tepidanaerobacteraceae bacterium]
MSISQYAYQMLYSYGYYGLFIILLLEGLGLPLPIQLAFMATVYLIHINAMSVLPVIAIATVGNLSGNILAYYLGYYGGKPIFEKIKRILRIKDEDINRIKSWFDKYGSLTNMVSRWIGITRTPAIWAAGLFKIDFFSYALFSFIGDLLWTIFWVVLFTRAHSSLNWFLSLPFEYKALSLISLFFIVYISWRWFFKVFKNKST